MKSYIVVPADDIAQSFALFGIEYKPNRDGSFTAIKEFDSENEAIEYLTERAKLHLAQYSFSSDMDFAELMSELEMGTLTLDSITAYIVDSMPRRLTDEA